MDDQAEVRETLNGEHYDTVPAIITAAWVKGLGKSLEAATWKGQQALKQLLPPRSVAQILAQAVVLAKGEPTLVEVTPPEEGATVTVVGDTHGQIHDLLNMFETAGYPSETNYYVFNGDFVDRGAWGLEVLLILAAWKSAFPRQVILLRGNHETTTCTMMYGFKGELDQKFSKEQVKPVYAVCKKLFAALPLAACIGKATLILHGGLFRKPTPTGGSKSKSKRKQRVPVAKRGQCELGTIADLRAAGKGGPDPNGRGATGLATDVLWSDPVSTPGIELNVCRGVGTIFGPDVTQRFLEANGLKLVLRSHEGPDARYDRSDMPSMQQGWTLDHKVEAGRLLTVFSAPDYPQFQADESSRYGNLAAVARLKGPDWCTPEMIQFSAVLPRPHAVACYDYIDIPGSDEEVEFAMSEASGASSIASDLGDTAAQPGTPPVPEASAAVQAGEEALSALEPALAAQALISRAAEQDDRKDANPSSRGAPAEVPPQLPLATGHTPPACAEQPADVPGLEDQSSPMDTSNDQADAAQSSQPPPASFPAALREQPGFSSSAGHDGAAMPLQAVGVTETGQPVAIHQVAHPGRELEQAAAQALAMTAGAAKESPSPVAGLEAMQASNGNADGAPEHVSSGIDLQRGGAVEEQGGGSNKRQPVKAPDGQMPAKRPVKSAPSQAPARAAKSGSQRAPWR